MSNTNEEYEADIEQIFNALRSSDGDEPDAQDTSGPGVDLSLPRTPASSTALPPLPAGPTAEAVQRLVDPTPSKLTVERRMRLLEVVENALDLRDTDVPPLQDLLVEVMGDQGHTFESAAINMLALARAADILMEPEPDSSPDIVISPDLLITPQTLKKLESGEIVIDESRCSVMAVWAAVEGIEIERAVEAFRKSANFLAPRTAGLAAGTVPESDESARVVVDPLVKLFRSHLEKAVGAKTD